MPAAGYRGNGIMRAICRLAGAIAELAMLGSASAPHAQETKLLVPNVTVRARGSGRTALSTNPGSRMSEILMPAAIAWRKTNSRRCRAM
jgi:hypothetical protein